MDETTTITLLTEKIGIVFCHVGLPFWWCRLCHVSSWICLYL